MPLFRPEYQGEVVLSERNAANTIDSVSAASLALGLIAAPVALLVVVVAVGAALVAYNRHRRRDSLDAYRPPDALSDPEAAASLSEESRSHTIQAFISLLINYLFSPHFQI